MISKITDSFSCWICKKRFKTEIRRENHEMKFHPRPPIYETEEGFIFSGGVKIAVHLGERGNKEDTCYIYWKEFEKQTGLKIKVDINKDKLWLEEEEVE